MITYDQVVDELKQLAAEKHEGYIYVPPDGDDTSSCQYVHGYSELDGGNGLEAGCLVGTWFHRFRGVALQLLQAQEGENADTIVMSLLRPGELEPRAANLLKVVQEKQDSGKKWGDAVRWAAQET